MFPGQPVHEDKNSGRLLLLRVRSSGVQAEPRVQLRQHGPADDRSHPVSNARYCRISFNETCRPTYVLWTRGAIQIQPLIFFLLYA